LKKVFELIDNQLFKIADSIEEQSFYQNLTESYNSLDDRQQNITRQILGAVLIIVPIFFFLFLYFNTKSLTSDLKVREKLLYTAHEVKEKMRILNQDQFKIIAPTAITTKNQLEQKISTIASSSNINSSGIKISDFNTSEKKGNIQETTAILNIKDFANDELFSLISSMASNQKFKFKNVDIKQNKKTGLITALLEIVHFGKSENQ